MNPSDHTTDLEDLLMDYASAAGEMAEASDTTMESPHWIRYRDAKAAIIAHVNSFSNASLAEQKAYERGYRDGRIDGEAIADHGGVV